jgi:hypothetical protein
MTIDDFVQAELERTGKRLFTVAEVVDMAERFIQEKKAAAEPFEGWQEHGQSCRGAAQETHGS